MFSVSPGNNIRENFEPLSDNRKASIDEHLSAMKFNSKLSVSERKE